MVESVDAVLEHVETVVIGNNDPQFHSVPHRLTPDQVLVDFVRIDSARGLDGAYEGICW
jgi:GDP-mannose 6-dehydrogenase